MDLVIDRLTWLRGGPMCESKLLDRHGKMCCLGFYAIAKGATPDQIREVTSPMALAHGGVVLTDLLVGDYYHNTLTCNDLMRANDNCVDNEAERERSLTELFKRINVNVTFIN